MPAATDILIFRAESRLAFLLGAGNREQLFGGQLTRCPARSELKFKSAAGVLGYKEHLGDVVAGYGTDVDRDLIRAW